MSLFNGLRRFDVPIFKSAWPFAAGGALTFWMFWRVQNAMLPSEAHHGNAQKQDEHPH